jgi:hypothetical protein
VFGKDYHLGHFAEVMSYDVLRFMSKEEKKSTTV